MIEVREGRTFDFRKMPGADMHQPERALINHLSTQAAEAFDPCIIVHIGVAWGASVYCSRAGAPNATIYGVDILGVDTLHGTEEQKAELDLQVIRGDSRVEWEKFNQPIHFLYVDGDHFNAVSSDIVNWGPKVVSGGYIAFHDCLGRELDVVASVTKAVDEHVKPEQWEYLGIEAWSRYYRRR